MRPSAAGSQTSMPQVRRWEAALDLRAQDPPVATLHWSRASSCITDKGYASAVDPPTALFFQRLLELGTSLVGQYSPLVGQGSRAPRRPPAPCGHVGRVAVDPGHWPGDLDPADHRPGRGRPSIPWRSRGRSGAAALSAGIALWEEILYDDKSGSHPSLSDFACLPQQTLPHTETSSLKCPAQTGARAKASASRPSCRRSAVPMLAPQPSARASTSAHYRRSEFGGPLRDRSVSGP